MEIFSPRNAIALSANSAHTHRHGLIHHHYCRRFQFRHVSRNPFIYPIRTTSINLVGGCFRFGAIRSKLSDFQDFRGYARPSRLFPAKEAKICLGNPEEDFLNDVAVDGSQSSLIKVKLQTSRISGSSLSDMNAGILLCIIDENGDSILLRIPSMRAAEYSANLEDLVDHEKLSFQRGSVDEFTFKGPPLQKVQALWISVESGQWRLGGMDLSVICKNQVTLEAKSGEETPYMGYHYDFDVEDILLGEGSESSMLELRPCKCTEVSGVGPFALLGRSEQDRASSVSITSNEESMREYSNLKLSLLLYDALIISFGTSVAQFSAGENAALAFLTGGAGGFLYLLLLQRSVDELPAPASISKSTVDQAFSRVRGPVTGLALAVAFVLLAIKYSSGEAPMLLTPRDIIVGMIGFLSCKVAVVLAAFKPMTIGAKQIE